KLGRELFARHARRVLAFVVVNLVARKNLAHRKRLIAEDTHGELPPRNESLDHHLVVVAHRLGHRGRQLVPGPHDRKSNRRSLLGWLHDYGPPDLSFHTSRIRRSRSALANEKPLGC